MLRRSVVRAGNLQSLIALASMGCNAFFDVEPTELLVEPPARDNDGDGIVNPYDNCVLVANTDQADDDADGLGDVCDPCLGADSQTGVDADGDGVDDGCDSCLTGTNHDEDGDSVGDGCDVCPAAADAAQEDADGDGVGDACDPDPTTTQRRLFFDGFGPPSPAWNTGFKPWTATADGFTPATPMVGTSSYAEGPWNSNANVSGPVWVIASVLVPPPELVAYEQRVGLSLRQVANGSPTASCTMLVDVSAWVQVGASSPTPIAPGRILIVLALEPSSVPGYLAPVCTVAGATVRPNYLFIPEILTPSLVANVNAEFEWIDVLH